MGDCQVRSLNKGKKRRKGKGTTEQEEKGEIKKSERKACESREMKSGVNNYRMASTCLTNSSCDVKITSFPPRKSVMIPSAIHLVV